MNTLRTKVHISKPCTENWEAMLPADQGRFCLNCQKTVIDFTSKTNQEILDYLTSNPGGCGRFYSDQVLQPHELPKGWLQQWKEYVAAASLVLATKLAVLTPAVAQTTSPVNITASQPKAEEDKPIFAADGNLYLRGTVIDPVNDEPLEGVNVTIVLVRSHQERGQAIHYRNTECSVHSNIPYHTQTDKAGNFELVVPAVELGVEANRISFELSGYTKLERDLHYADLRLPLVQYLEVKSSEPRIGSYVERTITMGAMPHSVRQLVAPSVWGSKPRTRAGFVLARVAFPYSWVKRQLKIRQIIKRRYSGYKYE